MGAMEIIFRERKMSSFPMKSDKNTMENNGLNGTYGIYYSGTMENNTAVSNLGSGVYLVSSSGTFLQYNNITLNGINGVYSYYSSLTVRENNITYNSPSGLCPPYCYYYGIYADHGSTLQIDHNRIENNSVSGVLLYYITESNVIDNAISDNHHAGIIAREARFSISSNEMVDNYVHVKVSSYSQPSGIENNTIVGGGVTGIVVYDSGSSIMIANNTIKNSGRGMLLSDSSAKVFNNHIQSLTNIGIDMAGNSNEDVFNNTISQTLTAVGLFVYSPDSGSPYIHNNSITDNDYSGIFVRGEGTATPLIKYNNVSDNRFPYGYGIMIERANAHPTIINNTIWYNYHGIHLSEGANATVHGCNIYDNDAEGIYNVNSSIIVNATENWWGHADGPHDPSPIFLYNYNFFGQYVKDWVRYKWDMYGLSWLTSPAQW